MGSRTEGLQRLLVIINKLKGKKRYIPARELKRYIAEAMEMRGYSGKSGRTLERGALRAASSELRLAQCAGRGYEPAHVCAGGAPPSVAERMSADADKCH